MYTIPPFHLVLGIVHESFTILLFDNSHLVDFRTFYSSVIISDVHVAACLVVQVVVKANESNGNGQMSTSHPPVAENPNGF